MFCLKNDRDSPMTDSTFVFLENHVDSSLYFFVLIRLFSLIEVIVVSRPCHVRNVQEYSELMLLP